NWLAAVLLLEADPPRRTGSVYKIMRSLDNFINIYPDDGASDEGPGYWGRAGASLFDNLELLRSATNGTIDIYRAPLVRSMGQYIYRVYINDQYVIPMGDASAKLTPDAELVYQYGKRIGDPVMQGFGALLAQRRGPYRPGSSSPGRILPPTNGVLQAARREFQAKTLSFNAPANRVPFSADIASAYPAAAAVQRWQRRVTLDRKAPALELEDKYELKQWKEPVRLNLITPLSVDTSKPGAVHLGGRYVLTFDAHELYAAAEAIP